MLPNVNQMLISYRMEKLDKKKGVMDRTEIEPIDSLNYYGDVIYKDTNI